MKKQWFAFVLVMALMAICAPTEAQVPVYNTNGTVAYGVPAGPYNGTIRHDVNGYVGVNPRHYSRVPIRYGTGPIRATGPIYAAPRPYATYGCAGRGYGYPVHYGGAYIARRPFGGGIYHGGANVYPVGYGGGSISVGVSGPGYSVGGSVGW